MGSLLASPPPFLKRGQAPTLVGWKGSYGRRALKGPKKGPKKGPRKAHRQLPGAPAPEGLGCPRESKRPRDEATWGRAGGHMGPGNGEP